jgi:hypothetical protein
MVLTMSRRVLGGTALCLSLVLSACTSGWGASTAQVPAAPNSDESYKSVLAQWHTRVSVFDKFQKVIEGDAVLFSNEMRSAYASRWKEIRNESGSNLGDLSSGKMALVVSYFTPKDDFMELNNAQLWTLQLKLGGKMYSPALVQRLFEKSALEGFFPFVNKWTTEYLVVFDVSSDLAGEKGLVQEKAGTEFSMNSSLVKALFRW